MIAPVHDPLHWTVHLPNLLREAVEGNPSGSALAIPMTITGHLLAELAQVALEIDDPRLHRMMLRLTLYDQADPQSEAYNPGALAAVERAIEEMQR